MQTFSPVHDKRLTSTYKFCQMANAESNQKYCLADYKSCTLYASQTLPNDDMFLLHSYKQTLVATGQFGVKGVVCMFKSRLWICILLHVNEAGDSVGAEGAVLR